MNITRAYGHTIAAALLVIYLLLPATLCASSAIPEFASSPVQAVCSTSFDEPCGGCPCSDRHGEVPGCCDTVFCSCPCHAPLGQGLQLTYAPLVANLHISEPFWSLPQVYRTIFVPPQNHS